MEAFLCILKARKASLLKEQSLVHEVIKFFLDSLSTKCWQWYNWAWRWHIVNLLRRTPVLGCFHWCTSVCPAKTLVTGINRLSVWTCSHSTPAKCFFACIDWSWLLINKSSSACGRAFTCIEGRSIAYRRKPRCSILRRWRQWRQMLLLRVTGAICRQHNTV
jgi:hypothetical protein